MQNISYRRHRFHPDIIRQAYANRTLRIFRNQAMAEWQTVTSAA
jgi:hypothetical protein